MSKECVNPASLFSGNKYGFSQIVTSIGERTVYLSGQTPFNAQEQIVGTTRSEQMRQCLRNVQSAMEAIGGTLQDVVSYQIRLINTSNV